VSAPHDIAAEVARLLQAMPHPWSQAHVDRYEAELAGAFEVRHAIAVASGTAALHTALAALEIGPGDEVLVPAASVVMSIAPVHYTGARPVLVDCDPSGTDFDYDDLHAKLTQHTRAVMPVYLWGRAGDPHRLAAFAQAHNLYVIEDACQAQGTTVAGRPLGTFGHLGCFSTKDGKLVWSGEGGFLLTDRGPLAARARAFRSHWQNPPTGQTPLSQIGHNYRLSEPQAVIARANLARFDYLLVRRQHQATLLTETLAKLLPDQAAHAVAFPQQREHETWNGYAALIRLNVPRPRQLCARLAERSVPNSVGTFGLVSADQRPAIAGPDARPCPTARAYIDATLAVILTEHDDEDRIRTMAATIAREITRWNP
jgi:dTDP-4-amino-4,6-dideoxygalactose transaminase